MTMSKALDQASQVPDPWDLGWPIRGEAWTAKHDRDGVPNRGYTRGLPGQTHCAGNASALEEIRSRIGTAASRDAVIGLEQGRISRSWQPDATTSRWRPWH